MRHCLLTANNCIPWSGLDPAAQEYDDDDADDDDADDDDGDDD